MNKKLSIYLASGWFTPRTKEILDRVEKELSNNPAVSLYSPRRDGIMLPPDQKHDTALRECIFNENISHILNADLVVANIDSVDSYNDPGTIYEVGYAMANNVPVLGYAESDTNLSDRFNSIIDGFHHIVFNLESLNAYLDEFIKSNHPIEGVPKILFVGTGNEAIDSKLISIISDSGTNVRWINSDHNNLYARINEAFTDVDCVIAVIDDRKTIPSWIIGQSYARDIPVITYSDFNYGINIMLLVSVLTHLKGTDDLVSFLQQLKRGGIKSIPKLDISDFNAM